MRSTALYSLALASLSLARAIHDERGLLGLGGVVSDLGLAGTSTSASSADVTPSVPAAVKTSQAARPSIASVAEATAFSVAPTTSAVTPSKAAVSSARATPSAAIAPASSSAVSSISSLLPAITPATTSTIPREADSASTVTVSLPNSVVFVSASAPDSTSAPAAAASSSASASALGAASDPVLGEPKIQSALAVSPLNPSSKAFAAIVTAIIVGSVLILGLCFMLFKRFFIKGSGRWKPKGDIEDDFGSNLPWASKDVNHTGGFAPLDDSRSIRSQTSEIKGGGYQTYGTTGPASTYRY